MDSWICRIETAAMMINKNTAIADEYPSMLLPKAWVTILYVTVSVEYPGPPFVITFTISYCFISVMILMITEIVIPGIIIGIVI